MDGGQYITAKVDIKTTPVYVKGGSIVPTGPDKQYVAEKVEGPVVLNIYPGADASFTLYEDEGTNYNYENGAYSTIEFIWNDAASTLVIGRRQGSFKGMADHREFEVSVLGESQTVRYDGKEVTIAF